MLNQLLQKHVKGVNNLFFPNLCIGCYQKIAVNRTELCMDCEFNIPKTNQYLHKENKFTEKFKERIPLITGAAYYQFTSGGHTQKLIHQIKYHGKKDAAIKIGEFFGSKLIDSALYHDIDVIVPVPMNPIKERIRGYNQANVFAEGLSNTMGKPFEKDALKKEFDTISQTKKGRLARIQNVDNVFSLGNIDLENKYVLLVDDVLTTGATLEACAEQLLKIPNIKISMATIAIARGNF